MHVEACVVLLLLTLSKVHYFNEFLRLCLYIIFGFSSQLELFQKVFFVDLDALVLSTPLKMI